MTKENLKRMKDKEKLLPYELAKEWFNVVGNLIYWKKPKTGIKTTWLPAGHVDSHGYRKIGFNGYLYKASRLIWLLENGKWPENVIDHINGNKLDDRIENLRDVSFSTNKKNGGALGNMPYKYISKVQSKECKQGFFYRFALSDKQKMNRSIKSSISLSKLLVYRNEWLKENDPERWAIVKRFEKE